MPVPLNSPVRADVAVVGSGAGGSAVAGELARKGWSVVLVEAGPQLTSRAGRSMRNSFPREDEQDRFAGFILASLVNHAASTDGLAQLPGMRVAHAVGGMLALWLNNCPQPHSTLERDEAVPPEEWLDLLAQACKLLRVSTSLEEHGVRQQRILERLRSMFPGLPDGRGVQAMPVAGWPENSRLGYSGADVLLYGDANELPPTLTLVPNHVARRLVHAAGRVSALEVHPRDGGPAVRIEADAFVVAAGTIGTPQLLVASGVEATDALGRYVMDHPSISSRIVLAPDLLVDVPADDPMFNVWIPLSERRDIHVQVYRFGFEVPLPPGYTPHDTADIISLCGQDPDPRNRLLFEAERLDPFGLPAVSAEFRLSVADRARVAEALADQFAVAAELGMLAHGFAPTVWPLGSSFHLAGSCRIGGGDDGESVADSRGRVWGYANLSVAGNAVISMRTACNPTLTTVALALRCADGIARGS